jgi:hypothetical protein
MKRLKRYHQRQIKKNSKFKRRAIAAGTAAAITFGIGTSLSKARAEYTPDSHELAVSQDADSDLLANREEAAIGYQPYAADQNKNETPDGAELAQRCVAVVNNLPVYVPGTKMMIPNRTYKVLYVMFGLERCNICGQEVNMGGCEIINPTLGLQYPDPNDPLDGTLLPDLALHYMEHGSFDCFGDIHSGRVDIARFLRVLEQRFPYDPNDHQLSVDTNDLDGDLLTDSEELAAGYNLYNTDQNENLVPDGIELAKQCVEIIDALPVYEQQNKPDTSEVYKVSFMQRGLETCEICGQTVNMGYWLISNPRLGLSIEVPEIVSHYMQHGSFSFAGDVHGTGRIDVAKLAKLLEMPRRCGDLGTIYNPLDLNKDCKVDIEDLNEIVKQWLEDSEPIQ